MNKTNMTWTESLHSDTHLDLKDALNHLCNAFNYSPFFNHNGMIMRVQGEEIEGYVPMQPHLLGNTAFQILHGGVAATLLDSIGGVVTMSELYKRADPEQLAQVLAQIARVATVDMRVDYLMAGRGEYFIAKAEILRMGRKGSTVQMKLTNHENQLIAVAMASYTY